MIPESTYSEPSFYWIRRGDIRISHELIGDRKEYKGVIDERNDGGSVDIFLYVGIQTVFCWSNVGPGNASGCRQACSDDSKPCESKKSDDKTVIIENGSNSKEEEQVVGGNGQGVCPIWGSLEAITVS